MSLSNLQFPSRRGEIQGKWAPLMFEPVLGSGERLTVAVVAALNGKVHVKYAPALERFECLYGAGSADVLIAVHIAIEDLKSRADSRGAEILADTDLAVHNAYLGAQRDGNGASVEEILDGALRLCSSFANWSPPGSTLFLEEGVDESLGKLELPGPHSSRESQLVKLVSGYVVDKAPGFERSFSRRFRTSKSGRASKIDFAGQTLVANLRPIYPGRQLASCVDRGKAGLLDLEIYRGSSGLLQATDHALFLHVPTRNSRPDMTRIQKQHVDEAVEELTAIASKQDLKAVSFSQTDQIGEAILRGEGRLQMNS